MRLVAEQRYLGPRSFLAFVIVVYLIQILAIDMYAPALPAMQDEFAVTPATLNSTVFSFLVAQAILMVVSGPLSDQFGRKPVFVGGCVAFTLASIACMLAQSVSFLVVARIFQAFGMGCSATVSAALVKDAYAGNDLKLAMTLHQSLIIVGPVAAPFLGSFMMAVIGWRGIFGFLTIGGLAGTLMACMITETYDASARGQLSLRSALSAMLSDSRALVGDRGFSSLSLFIGVTAIPFFAFIATSSYILLDDFALSYGEYSVVYAAACAANCVAPFVYMLLSRRLRTKPILFLCVVLTAISFAAIALFGSASPVLLLAGFIPYALAEGIARPCAFVVLLDQPQSRVGTASALANFAYGVITAIATVLATLTLWPTLLFGLTTLMGVSAVASLLLFLLGRGEWSS